jgi:tetratricopeptide (TPR) repeat protein
MKMLLVVTATLALAAGAVALVYQAAARDRDYRRLLTRGDAAVRDEQTFGAIEAYSGAIALRPDAMLPHLRRGETYLRRGEFAEAARDFRAASTLDPTATRPLEALGDVFYQMKRFARAADSYARNLEVDDRSADVSYKLALSQYRMGELDAALATLATTLTLSDGSADAHYLMGLCLRDQNRVTEAIDAFQTAVAVAPGHIPAREELSDLYRAAGRRTEEIEQLQMIATLDRDHVERQVALGLAQARAGQEETAVATLGAALDRSPEHPLVYRALGEVWLDWAQAHDDRVYLSKALEALGRVASGPDANSDILTLYGRALLLDGRLDAAERVLQQATLHYPIDPTSLLQYATVAERLGRLDAGRQALVDYSGLIGEDGHTAAPVSEVAALSLRLHDPQTAVAWLDRGLRLQPEDVDLLAQMAEAQILAGNKPGAQAALTRGLLKDPANQKLLALTRRVR